jgi:two-component system, OmpR family, copper resistance phosphate regulon response regulator CusR
MNRILIAEDEARLAAFVEKGLKKNGFSTAWAEDGQQALDMTIEEEFDLLLLDLGLPLKDGLDVLRELRAKGDNLPTIVVTAVTDDKKRQEILALGANDFIAKPFRFSDLLDKVRSRLSANEQ